METLYNKITTLGKLGLPVNVVAAHLDLPARTVVEVWAAANLKAVADNLSEVDVRHFANGWATRTSPFVGDTVLPFPQLLDGLRAHGGGQAPWKQYVLRWRQRNPNCTDVSQAYATMTKELSVYGAQISFYVVRKWWMKEAGNVDVPA